MEHILSNWGIKQVFARQEPSSGTANKIVLLETEQGRLVLRQYYHADRARIEKQHALIAWLRSRGIPAVAPLSTAESMTVVSDGQLMYALFPHAEGIQIERSALARPEVQAMGHF